MGTYICGRLEKKVGVDWKEVEGGEEFFDFQSYFIFGWLADVRNYSAVPPLTTDDNMITVIDQYGERELRAYCLSAETLLNFDYDQVVEDRRCTVKIGEFSSSGAGTCEVGEGDIDTYRNHLGDRWFEQLDILKASGAERLVFWFD